jgi:hypothetical protein
MHADSACQRSQQRPCQSGKRAARLGDRFCPPRAADELWCFRQAVGPLAAACAMERRTALEAARGAAADAALLGLVQDARGPLAALRTFGGMLLPRLPDGEPDKDLVQGIVVQVCLWPRWSSGLQGPMSSWRHAADIWRARQAHRCRASCCRCVLQAVARFHVCLWNVHL